MKDLMGEAGRAATKNEIRHFEIFTDGRFSTITLRHPDLVIERSMLIRRLAAMAHSAGVEVVNDCSFEDLNRNGEKLAFRVSQNGDKVERSTDVLVGADGSSSQVARSAGWDRPFTAPLVQSIVDLPGDQPPDTTRVWFIPDETPYFYWLIPHSATQGVLGLIGKDETDEEDAMTRLKRFLERKKLDPLHFQSAQVPIYRKWTPVKRRFGNNLIYLAGDAAGHVKVSTVGGIVTGFLGAEGIAESILHERPSPKLRQLKRELARHRLIRKVLNRFGQEDYSRLLDLLNDSAKHFLGRISRDESGKLLWNLIIRRPSLLALGLRSLLRM